MKKDKVSEQRLAELMPGFFIYRHGHVAPEVVGVRRASAEMFLRFAITFQGKRHEAVYAHCGISPIAGPFMTKGLYHEEILMDVASDKRRGWAILEDQEAAKNWECAVASLAPGRCEAYLMDKGVARILTKATERARRSSRKYAELVDWDDGGMDIDDNVFTVMDRLAPRPDGFDRYYRPACISILRHCKDIDGDRWDPMKVKPWEDLEFNWVIQLTADSLFRRELAKRKLPLEVDIRIGGKPDLE